tara:strand:+ start:33192 stop:34064 length:873 start_codon:yes stop_codon:yes gene_type:complete
VKKLKHSKFKNTGILFELLVRQITADILDDTKESHANRLMRKYFAENTALGKEQRLYQLLLEESASDAVHAERLVDAVSESHKKLDSKTLAKLRYELVREMRDAYPIDDFLRSKISNYKTYASIYKLFESKSPNVYCDAKELYESKNTVISELCNKRRQKTTQESSIEEEYEKHNEDLRLISYKLLVDRFNEKYSALNEDQQLLLKNYINNISNTNSLREYVNMQIPKVKSRLEELTNTCVDDEVVKIKLGEVVSQLNKISDGRLVKDSQVSTLLMSYELIKELEKHGND